MNATLHNTNSNSVTVKNFSEDKDSGAFVALSVWDYDRKGEMNLFFSTPAEALNFALLIQEQVSKFAK